METHFPDMSEAQGQMARDRMLASLRALADDAEALLRATADEAGEKAKEARARLGAALDRAKSTYQELQAHGIDSAKAAAQKADDQIRAHPYESIAIAFGVGLLVGAFLQRK